MKKLKILRLTIIATVLSMFGCSSGIDKKQLVEDLVFLPADEITTKYGGLDSLSAEFDKLSYTWSLENGGDKITCMVFYTDSTQENKDIIRIKNAGFDELFYYQLDWELPHLEWNEVFGKTRATEIHGIKEAMYHKGAKTLNIVLNNPKTSNFGKRIK